MAQPQSSPECDRKNGFGVKRRVGGQATGLTRQSRGCYTHGGCLPRGFQRRVAAAPQPAVACRVFPLEISRVPCQRNWQVGLFIGKRPGSRIDGGGRPSVTFGGGNRSRGATPSDRQFRSRS
jgi:hypothetical protein